MRNEVLAIVLHELAKAGIRHPVIAKGGKHIQVRWSTTNGLRTYVVGSSPSDHRAGHNARSEVRRLLRGDGLLPAEESTTSPLKQQAAWKIELERLERRIARLEAKLGAAG
jgi:hypothetical protein